MDPEYLVDLEDLVYQQGLLLLVDPEYLVDLEDLVNRHFLLYLADPVDLDTLEDLEDPVNLLILVDLVLLLFPDIPVVLVNHMVPDVPADPDYLLHL